MVRGGGWPRRGPLSSLSPRRRSFVVAMTVLVVVVGSLTAHGVADEFRRPPRADPSVPGTVVLVPGYGGDRNTVLASLALRLGAAGRRTVVVALPDGGTGSFAGQAAAIDATVAAALRRGAPSVDVVAYSAGGVATWLWLTEGRTAPAARRVVTLAAPLRGAELASAGSVLVPDTCSPACRELAPGSALLTRLAATGPPDGVPWLSLWTRTDEVVTPPDSARLPGVADLDLEALCPGAALTHARLPLDLVVVGLVLHGIDRRPTPAMTSADCTRLRMLGAGRPRLALDN